MKNSFWKPSNEILSEKLVHRKIDFQCKERLFTFDYETNAETSLEIKKAFQEYAVNKDIRVIGG